MAHFVTQCSPYLLTTVTTSHTDDQNDYGSTRPRPQSLLRFKNGGNNFKSASRADQTAEFVWYHLIMPSISV